MKKSFDMLKFFACFCFAMPLISGCSHSPYTLIFHTNSEYAISSITKTKQEFVDYDLPIPQKEGYSFDGWYVDTDFTEEFNNSCLSNDSSVELFAKYTINTYKITIHYDGETIHNYKYNEEISLEPLNIDEYDFVGYYLDSDFKEVFNYKTMPARNIDLYPKFNSVYYTIIFHTNTEITIPSIFKTKDELTKIDLPVPQKDEYKFDGWFLNDDLSVKFDINLINKSKTVVELYAKYSEILYDCKISVEINIPNSVTLSGGDLVQNLKKHDSIKPIEITSNYGYEFLYYEVDGRKYKENIITLDNVTSDKNVKIFSDYVTHELPIINVNTNNQEIVSKIDYVNMDFSLLNTNEALSNVSGKIRLRGNSTMNFPKKPYRIKFDKKQSLFGLEKAKSWVLLADYLDPSCLHNYLALSLGKEFDALSFTPTPHKVNLYLNGNFNGLYTLCEQVQEGKGRIDIEKEITEEMVNLKDFNFFISMDENVVLDEDSILNETYFYLDKFDRYIELKYPEKENFVSDSQFNKFFSDLKEYVNNIFERFEANDTKFIKENVNVDSIIDYAIIDQFMGEIDHTTRSFNMYFTSNSSNEKENNKLSFGPIWDYDMCFVTPWTGKPNEFYTLDPNLHFTNIFFQTIPNNDYLYTLLKNRYKDYGAGKIVEVTNHVIAYEYSIMESLRLNANYWYEQEFEISMNNLVFLNKYLVHRKNVLDSYWL